MRNHCLARSAYLGCLITLLGCTADRPADPAAASAAIDAPVEIASPAAPGSGMPSVNAGGDGVLRMSWLEPADTGHALRFATLEDGSWSAPRTIAASADWFVNWADFPSIVALPDGTLAAHWLAREGAGTYAYGVRISLSHDGGASWSEPVTPHRDGTQTEHGFVTLYPAADGGVAAVWLDGRNMSGAQADGHDMGADMTLRSTTIALDGTPGDELLVDDRTCECCQTDVALAADGPVLVYRNRSPEEIRDIGIARFRDGLWTEPRIVHDDGWEILACPVNGPAVAAAGDRIVVAWFTAAQDTPRVLVAFSDDGGETFGAPIRADDGDAAGRVDVLLLDAGDALLSWLEHGEPATVRIRRVTATAGAGPSTVIAETSSARASGFPRMARSGDSVVFAWTVAGDDGGVRTAATRVVER